MTEWDRNKAGFYLVATVIVAEVGLVFLITGSCIFGILDSLVPVGSCKDTAESMFGLLAGVLAAAIAIYMGTKPPTDGGE